MKKTMKKFLAVICASIGLFCLTAAFHTSFKSHNAAAETQNVITSSSIIKTSVLGDIDVSSLKMVDGAAVRLKDLNDPNTDENTPTSRNGLRFTALFNKKIYNTLEELDDYSKDISVGYGMLIVPYDYIGEHGDVTVENIFGENPKYYISGRTQAKEGLTKLSGWYHLDLPEEDGDTREKEIYCSIINIAQNQLTRQWVGVAYIEYVENGVAQYYMTEVKESNARSMVYVAQRAIQDTSSKAPNDDQKKWLKTHYTTYTNTSGLSIPTKEYTYTINHILVDPLGNEEIKESKTQDAKALYSYNAETKVYTANKVSANDQQSYAGYTYNAETSITEDIVYANHKTALNYYYEQNHCDIQFIGEKCTIKMDGKEGKHLSYVVLDGAESFSFSIVPDVGYSSGTVTVKVDDQSVTPDNNGLYTVSLSGKEHGDVIAIKATVNAGTVSDQVFEDQNYESKGEQSQRGLGVIAGWLGFGKLTVDEDKGTITSTGGSLELSSEFIQNALEEGYTHMVCDVSVSGGIGTFKKLEMVHGKEAATYQKVGTETSRTDRIDLTEFKDKDGTYASLMFRAYRKAFFSDAEQISSSATVQLSNIRMYKSQETADWKKYQKSIQNGEEVNTPITNAYAAYENGNLVIETMLENTFFERSNSTLAYDLAVGVSMSFAFKYLNAGNNTEAFFYHFTNTEVEHKELSACHIDDNGFAHMCIMPETVQAAAAAIEKGEDVKFHFGLLKPASAMLILANSGTNKHSVFTENGDGTKTETVVADTWGYPYGHGIYNEFLQVKDAETAKNGVEFNINMYDNHTISLEITADFDFTGFWYGNNCWEGYQAGMYQFRDVDTIEVDGKKTYWTEIVYTHAYMDKGFNIHWREDVEGADGSARVGTMELHYTLTKDATMEYYSFVPDSHKPGIETSEEMHDGIKVEKLTGVEDTMFTMPVLDNKNEKTITLTVTASWDFSNLQYGAGGKGELINFKPSKVGDEYKATVSVSAVFTNGFHIYYPGKSLPEGVVKATIAVSVYVENFEASSENVTETEVLQADGWTKYYATGVQSNTVFNFPSMPKTESISVYVTTNVPLNAKDGVLSYGTPDKQMISLQKDYVGVNTSNNEVVSYYTFFTYCNPDYEGFQIALNASDIDNFPADAWVQIQYRFTDFKIKNTENVQYTGIAEEEVAEDGIVKQKATLHSQSSDARFWLNTSGFVEIHGTITSSAPLNTNVLYYGHGWDTASVIAIDPTTVIYNNERSSWTYSFVYNDSLENGFCIYYANNGENEFVGTIELTYQLFTIQDIIRRAENWSAEDGGTAPKLKANGHVEYTSVMKDGIGYGLYIDKSVFEIAYKNGYDIIGVTFASNDTLTAHILNGKGATVELLEAGKTEHTLFYVTIQDMYEVGENGTMTFNDMKLRFDYLKVSSTNESTNTSEAENTNVTVTIENVSFIKS